MKIVRACLAVLTLASATGCLEKPAPTGPGDGRGTDAIPGDSAVADGNPEVDAMSADGPVDLDRVDVPDGSSADQDGAALPDGIPADCHASCDGKQCGDNGCGGSCGECGEGLVCDKGSCVKYCDFVCDSQGIECGDSPGGEGCTCGKCDDGTSCTDDSCSDLGKCQYTPNTKSCDDGDPCTLDDVCTEGTCVGSPKDCGDDNPCTNDKCVDGDCAVVFNEAPCDDGDACTDGDECSKGTCQPGPKMDCDDGNPCTQDSCESAEGCQNDVLTETACDDGNPCTEPDKCLEGTCMGTLLPRDLVTLEACICESEADCETLDDGNPCNGTLECVEETGTCGVVPGSPLVCDDKVSCTEDSCVEGKGCLNTVTNSLCNDKNPCTDDSCDAEKGCQYEFNTAPCDDNDACTEGDSCSGGLCVSGAPVNVEDGNPCTDDSCDAAEGVKHTPNADPCTDNDKCTEGDACANGTCVPGQQASCDDSNLCTDDWCLPAQGCMHGANGVACDDGDACTAGDVCWGGDCAGAPAVCAPKPCQVESCDPSSGCVYELLTDVQCDDNNACTTDDVCVTGVCTGGPPPNCEDGNPCTTDYCDTVLECLHTAVQDQTPCGEAKVCVTGVCQPSGPLEDLDHDGVCPTKECKLQAVDSCPTTWNPDNDPAACAPLPPGFAATRPIILAQPGPGAGASTWRRTHEPVEVPLANGIIDDSVVGYWKLDGNTQDSSATGTHGLKMGAAGTVAGAFGDQDGALDCLAGKGYVALPKWTTMPFASGQFTMSLWVRLSPTAAAGSIFGNYDGAGASGMRLRMVAGGHVECAYYTGQAAAEYIQSDVVLSPDKWYHLACTYGGAVPHLYVNGSLAGPGPSNLADNPGPVVVGVGFAYIGSCNEGAPGCSLGFAGALDDVLLFNRALSPTEIAVYYQSHAPYGTKFAPGAQPDFDDLRVTETTPLQDEHQVPFEVIGPRPHSDTPCPAEYAQTPVADIPHIKDREDLCGVVAYWKMDGDGKDVMGKHDGLVDGALPAAGRTGQPGSALALDGTQQILVGSLAGETALQSDSITLEAWVEWSGTYAVGGDEAYIMGKPQTADQSAFGLYVDDKGGLRGKLATTVGAKYLAASVSPGPWVHLAIVYDGKAVRLYVDGLQKDQAPLSGSIVSSGFPFRMGMFEGEADGLVGKLDDVLIHRVAKSPEYIYRRANPGVPMVRFLAGTEPDEHGVGGFDWYAYGLHWGDKLAKQRPPVLAGPKGNEECHGLLSPCIGYAGWWRFNEGSGTVTEDSSTWKNAAQFVGGGNSAFSASMEGVGTRLDGVDDKWKATGVLQIPDGSAVTLEALASLDKPCADAANDCRIAEREKGDGGYVLGVKAATQKIYASVLAAGPSWPTVQGPSAEVGKPVAAGMSLAGGNMSVHVQGKAGGTASVNSPDTTTSSDFCIGAQTCLGSGFFPGIVDSVRLMSRALTPDEFLHYPMAGWEWGDGNWTLDCGAIICPDLPGYDVSCNARDHCEYANKDKAGWKAWDVWIYIPPGSFQMGSPDNESGHEPDETPVHPVTFAKGYFIGKYEIVVAQYEACKTANPGKCTIPSTSDWNGNGWGTNWVQDSTDPQDPKNVFHTRPEHPQNGLTWQQAKDFCAWLAPAGRLPTEAEWEYAAAGPVHRKYPWGNSPEPTCSNNTAVFNEAGGEGGYGCSLEGTWKVGSKTAGAAWSGALDMSGNLWEWNEDWYHSTYTEAPADGTAWVDPPGPNRVLRGGCFNYHAGYLRSAGRNSFTPGYRYASFGARCWRPLEP